MNGTVANVIQSSENINMNQVLDEVISLLPVCINR